MISSPTDNTIRKDLLSTLVMEMNILRRHVTSYPPGHPVTRDAAARVILLLERVLEEAESVTLGITRDTVIFGGHPLDRKNPVHRDFARTLSDRGIALLTIRRHLGEKELLRFLGMVSRSREEIRKGGGIEEVARGEGLSHIHVRGIDHELLRVTEEERLKAPAAGGDAYNQWEQMVRGLLDGTLDPFGEATEKLPPIDPEILAHILNNPLLYGCDRPEETYEAVIASFLQRIERDPHGGEGSMDHLSRFGTIAKRLDPKLRRNFLARAFTALGNRPEMAEKLFASLGEEFILETFGKSIHGGDSIPPIILALCRRFSPSRDGKESPLSREEAFRMEQRLEKVLREVDFQQYVPEVYQGSLERMAAARRIASGVTEAGEIREMLLAENQGAKVARIILEIMASDPDGETGGLGDSLAEICRYSLEMGDFGTIRGVCDHLPAAGLPSTPLQKRIAGILSIPEFLSSLVDAPAIWGKSCHEDVRFIISRLGPPCVPVLLDRLASEESMSLRRYYLECLVSLGDATRDEAVARLGDNRWFYVRNLVAILRGLNDAAAVPHLRRLLDHPHPRVRQETLRTLVHFGDPQAEHMLIRELESTNRTTLLTAIQLAERSPSPKVRERLLSLLQRGGITGPDIEVRSAVVRALAETGDTSVIPHLARLLRSRSILRTASLTRLKTEVVRSLGRYPTAEVVPLLREAAASGIPEVERAARETLRIMERKSQ